MPAGTITTGNHPAALWPGVHKWWGREYEKHAQEWDQIFESQTSEQSYEEDIETTGFGLAPVKGEGSSVSYDSESQGPTSRYTHVVYGLGYVVTREELEDDLYETVSRKRSSALAFSMATTKNIVGANVLNRAFNSSFTGGDGKELCATDHPTLNGTQSNELTTAADISEAAIEDLVIQISLARNTRGLKIALTPKCLVVPSNLKFDAPRIVYSGYQNDSANNAINVISHMGVFPDGVVENHYLTDVDAWFIKTNVPSGLTHFQRRELEFTRDNDFDTENAKAKATERYVFGWSDFRTMYGSPGA